MAINILLPVLKYNYFRIIILITDKIYTYYYLLGCHRTICFLYLQTHVMHKVAMATLLFVQQNQSYVSLTPIGPILIITLAVFRCFNTSYEKY